MDEENDVQKADISVENWQLEEYKPAWIDCDAMEPPEDFRTLPVHVVGRDILHPGELYY